MSQTAKTTPQSGKLGIFSRERKGHLAQWIKCWCQQETREHLTCADGIPAWLFFMLAFLSCFFLFSPGRTQLQGPQIHRLCWFALRQPRTAVPEMRSWTHPSAQVHPFPAWFWEANPRHDVFHNILISLLFPPKTCHSF